MYANMASRAARKDFDVEVLSGFVKEGFPASIYDYRTQNETGF